MPAWHSQLEDAAGAEHSVSAAGSEVLQNTDMVLWSLTSLEGRWAAAAGGEHLESRLFPVCCGSCSFPGHTKGALLRGALAAGEIPKGPGAETDFPAFPFIC